MSPRLSRISVLEQVPLFEGGETRQTLEDLVRLGRGLEESGYHRFWLAEHHSTGSFLSSAPDLLMMHILDATDRIRVGSGGVMAMHYGSLQMAERFATLATLHPGRVDMGLGRAPGGDMRAAGALNQGRVIDPDAINTLIEETVALLRDDLPATHPYASIEVRPRPAQMPEVWLLGSSGQSAAWAGAHDLNYAYAQFFTGRQQVEIMNHYRAHLPESPGTRVDGAPGGVVSSGLGAIHGGQTLSALCVSAAATREEAREQALVAADARFSLRTGRPMHFRDPATLDAAYRAEVERYLERDTAIIVGTYDEVAQALSSFAENHGTEEVMLISYIDDVEVKNHQYAELAARLL